MFIDFPLWPHRFCLLDIGYLVYGLTITNTLTALAYIAIPTTLWIYSKKTKNIPLDIFKAFLPPKWVIYVFITFILSCGIGHGMVATTLWKPYYHAALVVDSITALVSTISMIVIPFGLPGLLKPIRTVAATFPKLFEIKELLDKGDIKVAKEQIDIVILNLNSLTQKANLVKQRLENSNGL